jgi:hypothetical protein
MEQEVILLVLVPLVGLAGAGLVRDAFDLDLWIQATSPAPGAVVRGGGGREKLCKIVVGGGKLTASAERTLFLPSLVKKSQDSTRQALRRVFRWWRNRWMEDKSATFCVPLSLVSMKI